MLLHSDGFDSHLTGSATLSDGDAGWTAQSGVTIQATAGKFGGKSLRRAAATTGYAAFVNAGVEKCFAGYFLLGAFGGAATTDLLRMAAGQVLLRTNQDGDLLVYDGGGTLRITAAAARPAAYAWIEVHYRTGVISLYVNGLPLTGYTGAYTSIGSTFHLLGAAAANVPATDVDDFITWDTDGSYFNGYPLGPRRIHLHRPDGAGASTQWTPASGTNWAAVDDTDWSGGVGVTAQVAALKDLYSLSDLPNAPAVINAVVVKTRQENTGDNPAKLQHVLRGADTAEVQGPLQDVSNTGLKPLKSTFYRDPNGAAWTPSVLNSLQAGFTSSN